MWCPPARTRWQLPCDNSEGRDHLKKTSAKALPQMLVNTRISNSYHSLPILIGLNHYLELISEILLFKIILHEHVLFIKWGLDSQPQFSGSISNNLLENKLSSVLDRGNQKMVPPENNTSYALAYEDYQIGQRIILGSHLLTSEEIIEFANKWDPVPFHTDEKLVLNLRMKLNCCWGTPNCNPHKINTKPRR